MGEGQQAHSELQTHVGFFFSFFPWRSTERIEVIPPTLKKKPMPCVLLVTSGPNAESLELSDRFQCPRSESSMGCATGHCLLGPLMSIITHGLTQGTQLGQDQLCTEPRDQQSLFCVTLPREDHPDPAVSPAQLPDTLSICARCQISTDLRFLEGT